MPDFFNLADYDETIRMVLDSGGEFCMYPRGISMLPLLRQGWDCVYLAKPNGHLKKNDIAFYLRDDGHYVLHRVIKYKNGKYTMCGDNQTTLEEGIEDRQIIAYVSRFKRQEKLVTPKDMPYRIYMFLWQSFFIRRCFFFARKVKHKIGRIVHGNKTKR
mgnify:CR=1 FL=1